MNVSIPWTLLPPVCMAGMNLQALDKDGTSWTTITAFTISKSRGPDFGFGFQHGQADRSRSHHEASQVAGSHSLALCLLGAHTCLFSHCEGATAPSSGAPLSQVAMEM